MEIMDNMVKQVTQSPWQGGRRSLNDIKDWAGNLALVGGQIQAATEAVCGFYCGFQGIETTQGVRDYG